MLTVFKISHYLTQDCRLKLSKVFFSSVFRKKSKSDLRNQQTGEILHKKTQLYSPKRRTKMSTSTTNQNLGENKNIIFQGKEDRYQGVTVWSDTEPCDPKEFSKKLKDSLDAWKSANKRGIWFKVHLSHSDWVPVLVKNGFRYHHAKEDYVMLYLWLPSDEVSNIPPYAHTMIGVGAVVVNEKDQVLVVQEKYHITPTRMWKLPGGYVEPGENLVDAAIREVMEETNIRTEFESLLTLRHGHGGPFGCSDIYVVVSLKAKSADILKCEREISDCKWMNVEEYLKHPHIHELNRFFVHKHLEHQKHNHKIECRHGIHQVLKKPYTVYSVTKNQDGIKDGQDLEFKWSKNQL